MATRREDVELNLVASDKASPVIKDVKDEVAALEGADATVELTAQDRATADIDEMARRLAALDGDEATAVLNAEKSKLEREVQSANRLLAKVDGEKAEAVLEARDLAKAKIEAIDGKLDDLERRSVDSTLEADDRASGDINRVDSRLDELDRRTVDARIDATVGSGLTEAIDEIGGMPAAVVSTSTKLGRMAGPAGVIAAVAAAFIAAGDEAADLAVEADSTARFTGSSVQEASRLHAVLRDRTKIEAKDLLDIIAQMQGVLETQPELAEALGISMDQVRNDPLAAFVSAVDALNSDQLSANEKILIGSKLFGEEGVRQVNEIIGAVGPDGLRGEMDAIAESRVINEDDVTNAREMRDAVAELSGKVRAVAQDLGEDAVPAMAELAEIAGNVMSALDKLPDWMQTGALSAPDWFTDGTIENLRNVFNPPADPERVNFWENVFAEVTDGAPEAEQAIDDVTDSTDEAADAAADYEAAIAEQTDALNEQIDALEDANALLEDQIEAYQTLGDTTLDLRDAQRGVLDASDEYNQILDEGQQEGESSAQFQRRLAAALDDVTSAADDAADAAVDKARADATARGATLSHTAAVDIANGELLAHAATLDGPERRAILAHTLRINGIPEERITEILTDLDQNDVAQVERELSKASRTRTAAVKADANEKSIAHANNQLNAITYPRTIPYRVSVNNPVIRTVGTGSRLTVQATPYASGTRSARRGLALVGEEGPELIDLDGGEGITPADETERLLGVGGGSTVNNQYVTVNVPYGSRPADIAAALRRQERIQGPGN